MARLSRVLSDRSLQAGEKTFLEEMRRVVLPIIRELTQKWNGQNHSLAFTDADLVAGVLTHTHNLGSSIVSVTVLDPNGIVRGDIIANNLAAVIDDDTIQIDFTTLSPLVGTWRVLAVRD